MREKLNPKSLLLSLFSLLKLRDNRMLIALGLHSAAIIAFQLVLMQLISIMQWYHFAYMIISIAMLGFGAAGTALAIFRKAILNSSAWIVPCLISATGIFMVLSYSVASLNAFQFDVYVLFVERNQFWILVLNYIIYFVPFFTGALAIGIIFIKNSENIGIYYFSNLVGSGLGGLLIVILFSRVFAINALPIAASVSLIAAIIGINVRRKNILQWLLIGVGSLAIIYALVWQSEVPVSQYKSLSKTLLLPDAEIVMTQPDVYGRIDVVSSPALRYAPALSLGFIGEVPVKDHIYANGEFYAAIPHFNPSKPNIHDNTTEALPYILGEREKVLVLDAAAGIAVAHAVQNGANKVIGITSVQSVINLMENELKDQSSSLFHDQRVKIIHQSNRQYLFSSTDAGYDAIILPRMETFGGSTGLNAISEDYTLTIEAFSQMWDKLSDHGVIAVTSWMDYPPRTTLKIAATLAETLKVKGIEEPEKHLVALRSWGTVTFLLKKQPLTSPETEKVRYFARQMLFDPLLLPDIKDEERAQFNHMEDEHFFRYIDQIFFGDREAFLQGYEFHVAPAVDDMPYFSRFIRATGLIDLLNDQIREDQLFMELGYLIVWVTLFQGSILAIILIILPLLWLKKSGKGKFSTMVYFAALGLGYMFVEIILIQRFILYFGHPLYAISAVISIMLIASGLGSLYSGRFCNALKLSAFSTITVSVLVFVYALFLTPLLMYSINYPEWLKILLAIVLLFIPSFFMGMPFPAGIRVLSTNKSDQVPWAWGINGSLSVIATALATLIAVELGFRVVMFLATAFYLFAFAVAITTFAGIKKAT